MTDEKPDCNESMPDCMSVLEISQDLRVTPRIVYNMIESGELPAVNVGSKTKQYWRIYRDDFIRFKSRRRNVPICVKPINRGTLEPGRSTGIMGKI